MPDVRQLKDKAADLAAKGRLEKAAELYRQAIQGDPRDLGARHKLAEVLRRAGRTAEAVQAYRAVADLFAKDGLLIKAIAISKAILELHPEHVETQAALADLYAKRAVVQTPRSPARAVFPSARTPSPPARPPAEPEARAPEQTAFSRIASAAAAASDAAVEVGLEIVDAPADVPADASRELPRVPIFSDLSREAFVALTGAMALRRAGEGEAVLSQGDGGTSFYVVATGKLAVSKRDDRGDRVLVARLGEGDFFGEMALLSGAPRAANVIAEEPCELLEFRAEALLSVAEKHPHLASSLRRFYRQRLLANAMAMSPIFRPFDKGDRKLVMERFRAREVGEGETVVREGEPSDGLYVVLDGAVDVVKRRGGGDVLVSQLREGDLFGEMSCLRKAPASASVVVRRPGTLLRLPRREFDDLVVSYPQILELVAELTEERAEHLDAILSGHAQWTEEGLVLI